ncbi:MAG: helix-turn-helix domain-containing protein [Ruminiclostridium sp.]|nr:helix-turn-helix domain-containing protein [Ruminiclostridium sp.]
MSATSAITKRLNDIGKTQMQLAEELGISRQNLSNKMRRDNFTARELAHICEIIGLKLTMVEGDPGEYAIDYRYGFDAPRSDEQIERNLRRRLKKRGLKLYKKKGPAEVSEDYFFQETFYLIIPEDDEPADHITESTTFLTLNNLIDTVERLEGK